MAKCCSWGRVRIMKVTGKFSQCLPEALILTSVCQFRITRCSPNRYHSAYWPSVVVSRLEISEPPPPLPQVLQWNPLTIDYTQSASLLGLFTRYPLCRGLGGHQSQSGLYMEKSEVSWLCRKWVPISGSSRPSPSHCTDPPLQPHRLCRFSLVLAGRRCSWGKDMTSG
jgi:hypothetical protein